MYYSGNFLSLRTQEALLLLSVLSRECSLRGGGICKNELSEASGLADYTVRSHVANFLRMGIFRCEKKMLYPSGKLDAANLYDLIVCTDGWLHIGNANLDGAARNPGSKIYIRSCESKVYETIAGYLKSIPLASLFSEPHKTEGEAGNR